MAKGDIGILQLTKLYKQPTDQYGSYNVNDGTQTFREQWKGSMDLVMTVYNRLTEYKTTGLETITYETFKTLAGSANLEFYYDEPESTNGWSLINAEVTELEAGDNALLILTWGTSGIVVDPEQESLPIKIKWGLSWQSQTVSVYAYCGNENGHIDAQDDGDMISKYAQRTAIENWFNLLPVYENLKNNYEFITNQSVNVKLNPAEINIAKKIQQSKSNPIFHYPIMTRNATVECNENQINEILGNPDLQTYLVRPDRIWTNEELDSPITVPFPEVRGEMPQNWQWLSQGSNVNTETDTKTKKSAITVTTIWWGAVEWDKNFYGTGKDRWMFGLA